jgi:glycosyltransferase 2 family protein
MTTPPSETPTSIPSPTPEAPPAPPAGLAGTEGSAPAAPSRRLGTRLSLVGLAVSALALAGVVWWALRQEPPRFPSTVAQWASLALAVALYGVATLVRGERWQRLLVHDGAHPRRIDSQALNVVGYMGNNVLPARAGDAIRVVLMAPLAQTSMRTVVGTLLAERLLDIAVIVTLFVVVGYFLLGEVGAGSLEWIVLATVVVAIGGTVGVVLVRRNERLHHVAAPILSSTLQLRGRHGLALLGFTAAVWLLEAAVWMSVGAAAGFDMNPIEGCYLVALASVFALIPSGPGYAGTQDAAAITGILALGGTHSQAVTYLILLRFVIVVPITLVGLGLLVGRYGGLGRLRATR